MEYKTYDMFLFSHRRNLMENFGRFKFYKKNCLRREAVFKKFKLKYSGRLQILLETYPLYWHLCYKLNVVIKYKSD